MIFGPKNMLVGLDVGTTTIKVAEAVESKGSWTLKKFGSVELPYGAIEEGVVKDPQAIADKIRDLFRLYHIRQSNVAVSISGYSVIVKTITVQSMPEAQLYESISFEAEQYIPFDISDVNLDFHVLGETEYNPSQMNVLLVAAKKDMISDYIDVIDRAGLNLCIIDVDAFVLQNIYSLNYAEATEGAVLINIGTDKTSLNILQNHKSVFMRDMSMGCNQINRKISQSAGCTMAEAEDVKLRGNSDRISAADLKKIESAVVADWCVEIRRALDFYYSMGNSEGIKEIVLSGGGATIKEFRELLATEASVEVKVINPFAVFDTEKYDFDKAYLENIAPQAAIAMGLALRRVDDK